MIIWNNSNNIEQAKVYFSKYGPAIMKKDKYKMILIEHTINSVVRYKCYCCNRHLSNPSLDEFSCFQTKNNDFGVFYKCDYCKYFTT